MTKGFEFLHALHYGSFPNGSALILAAYADWLEEVGRKDDADWVRIAKPRYWLTVKCLDNETQGWCYKLVIRHWPNQIAGTTPWRKEIVEYEQEQWKAINS